MKILRMTTGGDGTFRYEVHNERYVFPQHIHHFIELTLMLDGEAVISVDDRREMLRSGQMALVFPFQNHSYDSERKSYFIIYTFSPSIISDFLQSTSGKVGERTVFDASPATLELFRARLIDSLDLSPYGIRSCLYSMLSDYSAQVSLCERASDSRALGRLAEYLNEHFSENVPLTAVARAIGYSPNYLSHCISKAFGSNYCSLLATIRAEHAKYLLRETESSVLEIALECGFGCERSFHRQFKRITGSSPREYRSAEKIRVIELKFPDELIKN